MLWQQKKATHRMANTHYRCFRYRGVILLYQTPLIRRTMISLIKQKVSLI